MEKNNVKERIRDIIFIVSLIILIFEENIVKYIGVIRYYDELLTLILFIRFVIIFFQNGHKINKINKYEIYIILFTILMVVIGLLSNVFSGMQSIKYISIDLFSCIELFLLYCSLKHFSLNVNNIMKILNIFSKFMVVIIFVCGILNLFIDIGMELDTRYGIKSFRFIYSNSGTLVIVLISLLAILDVNFKKNLPYIVIAELSMILTLRGLGIAAAGIYIALKFILRKNKKINLKNIVIIGIIALFLGVGQIYEYFGQDTPRNALLINGIRIANDYFPIGTGFGTYGSDVTKESYTDLYYLYGLNSYYGLSEQFPAFITDNYWPMIIAQLGWFGCLITLIILVLIYIDIRNNINKVNSGGIYLIIFYIIISSIAAQLLVHYLGVLLFLTLALLMKVKQDD